MIIKRDDELSKLITDPEIKFIKNLINPQKDHTGFIYQIVSNNLNAIDVDKFDYLIRDTTNLGLKFGFDYIRLLNDAKVIDNIICYPEQMYNEVSAIFDTRYKLHKQVYTHKVVISTQYMINDMMLMMEPIIHMYECITDMNKFYKLTDNYVIEAIKFFEHFKEELLNDEGKMIIDKVFKIWVDLNERRMYKFIGSIVSKVDKSITVDLVASIDPSIDPNHIIIHKSKIGFVSGSKSNPFEELYFYNNKSPNVCLKVQKEKVTFLISDTYQEYIYMFFVKDSSDKELIEKVKAVFKSFE
jgi:HD superfamily phosphohydrolase